MSVTVTWNASANGGTVNGQNSVTTSVTAGSTAAAPGYTPVKAGHSFKGWYTSASGGSLYNTVTVTSARTFYAQFTPATYTITWDLGEGQTQTTQQTYGQTLTLPTQPLKDGYTFLGWFTDAEGGEQVTGDTVYTATSPTTYYARWELIPVFSVTVPASFALTVSEQGEVYAASNAEVVNHSTAAVQVTGVTVSAVNGWTLVPYGTDMASQKVDSRRIGFSLNGSKTAAEGSSEVLALTGDWTVPLDGTLPLEYDAVVSALSQPVEEQVLSVTFVLEWAV